VEDDYLALGRLIAGNCPAGFSEAILEAELEGNRADLQMGCAMPDGTEVEPDVGQQAVRDLHVLLHGIREKMAEEDGRRWRTCTVTLRKGGHFDLDVTY